MKKQPMRIYLTGFMGAGKTGATKFLAQQLQWPFLDLDEWITQKTGLSIPEIFIGKGEAEFRKIEAERLHQTLDFAEAVIATGGGTPCFFENMEWMKKHGLTIYLKASPNLLVTRLKGEKKMRPLLAALSDEELVSFIASRLPERSQFYEKADLILDFDADYQPALDELSAFLKKFLES